MPRGLSQASAGRALIRDVITVGLVAGLGLTAAGAVVTWRIWTVGGRDEARPAGAIVVLGAAQYDGRPSPVFAARIDHAVELFEAGLAPLLIVTGGKQPGDRTTEAETARRYAIARGVPDAAIAMEDRGRDTRESVSATLDILRRRGVRDAIFVSDRTHMLRVLRMARDGGMVAWGSPTPSSPLDRSLRARLDATGHELGGLFVYLLGGGMGRARPLD